MIKRNELEARLDAGDFDEKLAYTYCVSSDELSDVKYRLVSLARGFDRTYGVDGERLVGIFSGPGRTEIGGNHTDHQCGHVLAASVNLDTICMASPNGTRIINIQSEGYPAISVDTDDLAIDESKYNTSESLVRGIVAKIKELGYTVSGFDGYMSSTVLSGSGLSSSAAYEVTVATAINHLFCDGQIDAVRIAQISQYAENVYFGKPSGLMDQMASSVGGAVSIDFADTAHPIIKKIDFDFAESEHTLCIIDSGADHADLNDEYASIPNEMKSVAAYFGKEVLRQVYKHEFFEKMSDVRKVCGDRATLRAFHYFCDDENAVLEARALEYGDFEVFLNFINDSGQSSYKYLQNIYCTGATSHQAVAVTLAVAEYVLGGEGACRVHGGGFAGTVQAFVPDNMVYQFKANMEDTLGKGCCHVVAIRPVGGIMLI